MNFDAESTGTAYIGARRAGKPLSPFFLEGCVTKSQWVSARRQRETVDDWQLVLFTVSTPKMEERGIDTDCSGRDA